MTSPNPKPKRNKVKPLVLCGRVLPLIEGVHYIASRKAIDSPKMHADAIEGETTFTVTIREMKTGRNAWTVPGFTYDGANDFLNQFNNNPGGSLHGRVW